MKLEIKHRIAEANIQAEFYHQCKLNKIPCYLEYKIERSRFDAVIYEEKSKEILCLLEIKSYKYEYDDANIDTKQCKKYSKYRIPLIYIVRMSDIEEVIKYLLKNIVGKPLQSFTIYSVKVDSPEYAYRI
jgi:hypothetical protein